MVNTSVPRRPKALSIGIMYTYMFAQISYLAFNELLSASMIETLELSVTSDTLDIFDGPLFMENLDIAPSYLRVTGIELQSITMLWGNITCVEILDFRIDECPEPFRRAPRLKSGYFEAIRHADDFTLHIGPVVQCHIEDLEMSVSSSCEQSNISDLLANIQLPTLESLSFDLRRDGHSLSSTVLESFLSRSSCHLRELKITSRSENDNLFSVLQKTPHLKSLQLKTYQQSANKVNAFIFIQLLTKTSLTTNKDPESQALLQSLSMHISILDAKQFGWDIVPNIFEPPSKTGPKQRRPLRRLCLCLDRPNRDQLFIRLSPLFFHDSWSWRMTGLVCI